MKRNLVLAALACLTLAGCKPSRNVSLDQVVVASQQPDSKADETPAPVPVPDPSPGGTFVFADDGGGKILAKILPPLEPSRSAADAKSGPKSRKGLAALEQPDVPLSAPNPAIPKLTAVKQPPLRPRLLPEAAPLASYYEDPTVPQRPELPSTPAVRLPSRDVNEPIPLPVQAKQIVDRASLDDPTSEFSGQRVVTHQPAMRSTPVPFVRVNLPEPFENRAVAKPIDVEPPVVAPVPMPPK